jgi:chemotaxis signal transduction protein
MNNMTVGISQTTIAANNAINNSLLKLLVFEVGKLVLALPIQQVQKVVRHNPIHGSGLSYVNLSHLGDQEVTVIDLHQKLFKVSQTETSGTGYFIISKNVTGEPLGIVVAQTPTIIDVPLAQIRTLPES